MQDSNDVLKGVFGLAFAYLLEVKPELMQNSNLSEIYEDIAFHAEDLSDDDTEVLEAIVQEYKDLFLKDDSN